MGNFESNADKVKKLISESALRGVTAACLLVEAQAKALATVDTGLLRDGITHKAEIINGELVGIVGSPTEYAPHVEYGTRFQKAQPFLLPAFRENKKNIEDILGEILKSEVGKWLNYFKRLQSNLD